MTPTETAIEAVHKACDICHTAKRMGERHYPETSCSWPGHAVADAVPKLVEALGGMLKWVKDTYEPVHQWDKVVLEAEDALAAATIGVKET